VFLARNEAIKIVLDNEDGDMRVFRNVGKYLPVDTAWHLRRSTFSVSHV